MCLYPWWLVPTLVRVLSHMLSSDCLLTFLVDQVATLVDNGADVTARDEENITCLHWAAINNRHELCSCVSLQSMRGHACDPLCTVFASLGLHGNCAHDGPV